MSFLITLIILIIVLGVAIYLTNPFHRLTIIRRPFIAEMTRGTLRAINNNKKMTVHQNSLWRLFAVLKNGGHILSTRYIKSPRSKAKSIADIVADIHRLRFNPDKLLLISGDHFSSLFVRNLGVFYYPMCDPSIKGLGEKDWQNRQIVYLQTLAYALGVFDKHRSLTTTIVPTGRYKATCVNFYAYPSDALYGILFALAVLGDKQKATSEHYAKPRYELDSIDAAKVLLAEYKPALRDLYESYNEKVFDASTGLISKKIHISGAKDITRRTSAFYDNVVFWKTTQLAQKLGLIKKEPLFLRDLKEQILRTFWLEQEGYFLEDLSDEGILKKYYSSDWLIVLSSGFLDIANQKERGFFEKSISYIQKENIDQPFAIKYQQDTRAHRQFLAVRLAVASYGGDSIWSFWGMEYIKSLLLLHKHTDNKNHLETADYHIKKYKAKMLQDGGFTEVYDPHGNLLQTPFYRSIRQTGWVIGFEQVLAMRENVN